LQLVKWIPMSRDRRVNPVGGQVDTNVRRQVSGYCSQPSG
jgi:hypothetical protein